MDFGGKKLHSGPLRCIPEELHLRRVMEVGSERLSKIEKLDVPMLFC